MSNFPYAGQKFTITMDNGLKVTNSYLNDGKTIEIEFLSGNLKGTIMSVLFTWKKIPNDGFLISWQESDKSTVVHIDNFEKKTSYAYYTTMNGDFYVMEGNIS